MKSPFPGMNPYLEQQWRDVHHRLVTYSCDQIQTRLPSDLRARGERGSTHAVALAAETDIALAQPLVIRLGDEPATQRTTCARPSGCSSSPSTTPRTPTRSSSN